LRFFCVDGDGGAVVAFVWRWCGKPVGLSLRVSTTGYTRNSNLLITYSTVKWFSYHQKASSKQLSLTLWSNNSKLKEDIIRSLATAVQERERVVSSRRRKRIEAMTLLERKNKKFRITREKLKRKNKFEILNSQTTRKTPRWFRRHVKSSTGRRRWHGNFIHIHTASFFSQMSHVKQRLAQSTRIGELMGSSSSSDRNDDKHDNQWKKKTCTFWLGFIIIIYTRPAI
jgi:hypothetical protein